MSTKRKTGKDYLKELDELDKSLASLKAHVKNRLEELIKRHPDAIVLDKGIDKILCKHITEAWLNQMSTLGAIRYILNIERWLAGKEKLKQLTIKEMYNEIPDEVMTEIYYDIPDELRKTLKKLGD
jgi:hypothetical protein